MTVEKMSKSTPFAEVLRRVLDESDDMFSSSDEEVIGNIEI